MAYIMKFTCVENLHGEMSENYNHLIGKCSPDWKDEMWHTGIPFTLNDDCGHRLYWGVMTPDQVNSDKRNEPLEKYGKDVGGAEYMEFCIEGLWKVIDPDQRTIKAIRMFENA